MRIVFIITMLLSSVAIGSVSEKKTVHKPFIRNENVTCILTGVYSWDNGEQYTKPTEMECIVINTSKVWQDVPFEKNYQHLRVDCSLGFMKYETDTNGFGLVKKHKLHSRVRWVTSNDCYHVR